MWPSWVEEQISTIKGVGRWREVRAFDAQGSIGKLTTSDKPIVSFASNDYLGLTQHPAVIAAAHAALDRWGTGVGASRLPIGSRPVHIELESSLARWKQSEQAIVFPTGFSANLGVISTFGDPNVLIISDELNHASIIDGCRLSKAKVAISRHNDINHIADLLATAVKRGVERAIVVTDTVFSMDGDIASIADLCTVCQRYNALLILDEAHAVIGPEVEKTYLEGVNILRVGTLSKTLASMGGFVAGKKEFIDLLVNRARSFIFSTALTPAATAAALAALEVVCSAEGKALCTRLRTLVERLKPGHLSPIIPIILGEEERTLAVASSLLDRGCLVPAIRPPTVPPGTSRLRISVSAGHTDAQIEAIAAALSDLMP